MRVVGFLLLVIDHKPGYKSYQVMIYNLGYDL